MPGDTAYPQLKTAPSAKELADVYTPINVLDTSYRCRRSILEHVTQCAGYGSVPNELFRYGASSARRRLSEEYSIESMAPPKSVHVEYACFRAAGCPKTATRPANSVEIPVSPTDRVEVRRAFLFIDSPLLSSSRSVSRLFGAGL